MAGIGLHGGTGFGNAPDDVWPIVVDRQGDLIIPRRLVGRIRLKPGDWAVLAVYDDTVCVWSESPAWVGEFRDLHATPIAPDGGVTVPVCILEQAGIGGRPVYRVRAFADEINVTCERDQ